MPKSANTLLYYIHHHGNGHLQRATFLVPIVQHTCTVEIVIASDAFYPAVMAAFPDIRIHRLNSKWDDQHTQGQRTFDAAFEGMPFTRNARQRAALFVTILYERNITHFLSDVSAELTIQARSAGVRCLMQRHSGDISIDPTQVFAYQCAECLFAPFPQEIEDPDFIFADKTCYLGFIASPAQLTASMDNGITIVHADVCLVRKLCELLNPQSVEITVIGCENPSVEGVRWLGKVADVAAAITSKVVICSGGNNLISELMVLGKSLLVLPEPRPYDEQRAKAAGLVRAGWAQHLETTDLQYPDRVHAKIEKARATTTALRPSHWAESFDHLIQKVM